MAYYNPYLLSDLNRLERIQRLDMPVDVSQGAQPTNLPVQAKGLNTNVYSQALMGGLQLASDAMTIGGQKLNIGEAPLPVYTPDVAPTYQLGDYASRVLGAEPQGASAGEVLGTAAKAAGTGASIGTAILPGIGTLIGAGVGAIAGAGTAGIAGGVRKRRQKSEQEKAMQSLEQQQKAYNQASQAFSQQQVARSEYSRRANPYRRMQNLFI